MDSKELKKILKEKMTTFGFRHYKGAYYYENDELIAVVALQKSSYDNDSYYLIYAFLIKKYNPNIKYPKYYTCDVNGRFIFEINGKETDNFNLEEGNIKILRDVIDNTFLNILSPVLEYGLSEYYKILPECIVSATLRTKEYLGIE